MTPGCWIAIAVAGVGAATDARTGRLPNALTLGALAGAPLLAFALESTANGARAGLGAAGVSVLGAAMCGAGPLVAFVRGGLGGGDVKLLAALGALLGPRVGLDAEFYGFVGAALYAAGKLAWHGTLVRSAIDGVRSLVRRTTTPGTRITIRLGPALALGTLAAVVAGGG